MCVFKYHAFIYFLRPPPWSGTMTKIRQEKFQPIGKNETSRAISQWLASFYVHYKSQKHLRILTQSEILSNHNTSTQNKNRGTVSLVAMKCPLWIILLIISLKRCFLWHNWHYDYIGVPPMILSSICCLSVLLSSWRVLIQEPLAMYFLFCVILFLFFLL